MYKKEGILTLGFEFINTNRNLTYFTIPSFSQTGKVVHAFSSRKGGASGPPFDSLNLGMHVGDDRSCVLFNRKKLCIEFGVPAGDLVAARQVHGVDIYAVCGQDRGRGSLDEKQAIPDVDALVTDVPRLPLVAFFADCTGIFFLDPVREVIALAHAGWKGTAGKIGEATVKLMVQRYGCQPKDILAGIAPSIGPCCYEVDWRVMSEFKKAFTPRQKIARPKNFGKWDLDLWEANKVTLMDSGIPENNITVAGLCTSCNNDLFFSYRADNGLTGRMAALLMLK